MFIMLCVVVSNPTQILAQDEVDSTFVRRFRHQITARVYVGEKISIFNFHDGKSGHDLAYRPNNILGIGIGTTVKGIGLNFSTRIPFRGNKEELYGKTRRYDIQLHRYRAKLALDGYFQRYRGFHLNTIDDVDSVVGIPTHPYFPDLTTLTLGASGMYVFNGRKFSMRGAVNQQDWQMRSAGSFMVGASFFARYIYNNGSILPQYLKYNDFFENDAVRHISNYGLNLKVGYGYNQIIRQHYFAHISAEAGAGPGYSEVRNVANESQTGFGLNMVGTARLAAGYNSDKWFGGFYFIFHTERYSLPYEKSAVSTSQGIIRLVVARRLFHNKF